MSVGSDCRIQGNIRFRGDGGNKVVVGDYTKISADIQFDGGGNTLIVGQSVDFAGAIFVRGNGSTVVIGDETTAVGAAIVCLEGCDVSIGRDCMLSREIEIRTSDFHSLIDRESGKRINLPASVKIGDHVWIGMRVVISKGVTIPSDTTIGAGSFVNGQFFEEGTVIAGTPSRVLKRGVTWDRRRLSEFDVSDFWRTTT